VCINIPSLEDPNTAAELLARADAALERVRAKHAQAEEKILVALRRAAISESHG
jgi:hypothetical protein